MKITIIGAASGVGLAAVNQALKLGHTVTALSTNTSNIPDHELLTKINGSATVAADLRKVMQDADAVLVTIGTKNKKPNTLFSDAANTLVMVGNELDFKGPILVITGFGVGKSIHFLSVFMWIVIRLFLKHQNINKKLMEEIIAKSHLNWEIVRPGMLTDGPLTKQYKILPNLYKGIKVKKISRADVAGFLLKEAENPRYIHQYPALTY